MRTEYQLWLYYPARSSDNWTLVEFCESREAALVILDRFRNQPVVWQSIKDYRIVRVEVEDVDSRR